MRRSRKVLASLASYGANRLLERPIRGILRLPFRALGALLKPLVAPPSVRVSRAMADAWNTSGQWMSQGGRGTGMAR